MIKELEVRGSMAGSEILNQEIENYRVSDLDEDFFHDIDEYEGLNALNCVACGTCSGACPVTFAMDHTPRQIMRFIQLGAKNIVFTSNTMWICAQCYNCQVRCPRGIKITEIMATLRRKAMSTYLGLLKDKDNQIFYESMLDNIRKNGRIHEMSFFIKYQMKKDLLGLLGFTSFGLNLFKKGKVSLRPDKIHNLDQIREIFKECKETES
jgi:heterodisulfide reductase subunit C